jgi:transposase
MEVGMSQQEVERAGVIAEVVGGRMRQRRAAEVLGLSCRQVKRLVRAWRAEGATGLRSRRRGRPGNRRHPDSLRKQVLGLAAERYAGFGPTLLGEYLVRDHDVSVSVETLRQWLIQAGHWKTRAQRHTVHRARNRRPRFGELIQIDGSPHDWLEGRGARCTMIVFIDDATSRVLYARLVPAETTQAYFDGVAAHLVQHGRPLAYYSDRHSIFRVNTAAAHPEPTQFERAMQALGVELICAHSPQAKGRVERVHQTFQDRFTKALRVAGIGDFEAANALLQTYLIAHNARFTKPALDPQDAHRPLTCDASELRRILSHHHVRTVDRNGAIRFERLALHIDPDHRRRTLGKRLTVIQSGHALELWHGRKQIPFTTFDIKAWHTQVQDRKTLDAMLDRQPALPRNNLRRPPSNHPWRHPPDQPR